jgi:hypothetical protein
MMGFLMSFICQKYMKTWYIITNLCFFRSLDFIWFLDLIKKLGMQFPFMAALLIEDFVS